MKTVLIYLFLFAAAIGCKEKYVSPVTSPETGYLVVEGVINSGSGTTNILLKRTVKLDHPSIVYETGAIITVDGEDNSKAYLKESASGNYSATGLNLNNTKKYRLNILTKNGKNYQSDWLAIQATPAIDSVSWKQDNTGVQLYINTHDPSNLNKYYQWDYTETWEYHSPFMQYLKYHQINPPNGTKYDLVYFDPILITFNAAIYKCWPTESSSSILLGSTVNLSSNKIFLPLNFISKGSVKISQLYSINTRQYSLSLGRYNYLQKMKKNTEGTGSVFDAQPSELVGNIHCVTSPDEPVVGYIDICQIQESRIFIRNDQLADWKYSSPCIQKEILNNIDSITAVQPQLLPTIVAKSSPFGGILSYYFGMPDCVDCTFFGTNIKPTYWP